MKLKTAIENGLNKNWLHAHVRRNPSFSKQWFVTLIDKKQMPFMLVDDNEAPILNEDLNEVVKLVQKIGIREFTVFL